MNRWVKKGIILVISGMLMTSTPVPTLAAQTTSVKQQEVTKINNYISNTAKAINKNNQFKQYEELSDWDMIALAKSGGDFKKEYYSFVEQEVKSKSGKFRKVTDLERIILCTKAMGKEPTNVKGYNLMAGVVNHDRMLVQGSNGPIYALIALDETGYKIPKGAKWDRTGLVKEILKYQNKDGGFALAQKGKSDISITAMALQALSGYRKDVAVDKAVKSAVAYLSKLQQPDGGYISYKTSNLEDTAQVIIALTELGISPKDSRFTKGNNNLVTNLLSFAKTNGNFEHNKNQGASAMATQQGLLALNAYASYLQGGK